MRGIPTECCIPLLQELDLDDLIDRRGVLQLVNEGGDQVLVVARENAQMVSRFVVQTFAVVGVKPHQDGGTTCRGSKIKIKMRFEGNKLTKIKK